MTERFLIEARKVLAEKGAGALYSPHAMTGRICRCNDCFCCAALQVYTEHQVRNAGPYANKIISRAKNP